jgi:hypothetical protein
MLEGMFSLQMARFEAAPEFFAFDLSFTWTAAWALVLLGLVSGAMLGLGFHNAAFLGGYDSWRRRLLRLGHIACVALGLLQMAYALSPASHAGGAFGAACRALWFVGAFAMPLVCWLAAWRKPLRHLFVLPVASLIAAVTLTLIALGRAESGLAP